MSRPARTWSLTSASAKGQLVELPLDAQALASLAEASSRVAIVDSADLFFGIKTFEPGEVFANHYHDGYDEFFVGLEGTISIWQGRSSRFDLSPGTSLLCRRGSHHMLVNEGSSAARLAFVKVPQVADDTIWVDWTPPTREGD